MIKLILVIACLGTALFMGFKGGLAKPKGKLWRTVAVLLGLLSLCLTFLPPLGGNYQDAVDLADKGNLRFVPVYAHIVPSTLVHNDSLHRWEVLSYSAEPFKIAKRDEKTEAAERKLVSYSKEAPATFRHNGNAVIRVHYDTGKSVFVHKKTISTEPLFTYPFVPALNERIRNMNLHIPMHWISAIGYLMSMIFAIMYLKKRNMNHDISSYAAASTGLVFTVLGTVTGMIWAKFNWGSYWNWDPRQTTIFVLMIIYFAYIVLRNSIEDTEARARLSSVYSILSFISVPFLIFIIPRLYASLHPGAQDDGNTGPVMSTQQGMLDTALGFTYYVAVCAFLVLFFWILNVSIRYYRLKFKAGQT